MKLLVIFAIVAFLVIGVVLAIWYVFTSPAKRALALAGIWYDARVVWRVIRRWYNRRRNKAPQRSRKGTLLSSNLFWLVAVALLAVGLVSGTETTFVHWWPSKETWRAIGFWSVVALAIAAVASLIGFLWHKGYLKNLTLSDALKAAASIAAIAALGYFVYWLFYGPKSEPSLARHFGSCQQLPAPASEKADVYELVAEPGRWTHYYCFPAGGYPVTSGAVANDARFKAKDETGREYIFTPEQSDQPGVIRQRAYMALGARPETIRIVISPLPAAKKVAEVPQAAPPALEAEPPAEERSEAEAETAHVLSLIPSLEEAQAWVSFPPRPAERPSFRFGSKSGS